jgi:hypothetical protein
MGFSPILDVAGATEIFGVVASMYSNIILLALNT